MAWVVHGAVAAGRFVLAVRAFGVGAFSVST
jgi:hypothetical protein